jgi:hypothetical protein
MPVRVAGGRTETFSPNDAIDEGGLGWPIENGEKIEYTVKYADGRAYVSRANIFSKVSYTTEDETGVTKTERDFPMGELQLETLMLVLKEWNLTNEKGVPYRITHANIMEYMDPEEIKWLYSHVIEMNGCWGGGNG